MPVVRFRHLPLPPDPSTGAPFVVVDGFGGARQHDAVDLATRDDKGRPVIGKPVFAVVDGFAEAREDSRAGKYVELSGGDVRVLYAHLTSTTIPAGGRAVRSGEVVGFSGATGNVTGPHLHFRVMVDGEAVDPEPMLRAVAGGGSSLALVLGGVAVVGGLLLLSRRRRR